MACPKGHLNPPDTRICIGCGYIFPLATHTPIGALVITEHAFQLPGRNLYWVKDTKQHTWLLSEAKEIYHPDYRQLLYARQRTFAAVLGEPPVHYWHQDEPSNRLIYTLHYAPPLQYAMPLEMWLRQQGLPTPEQLQIWLRQLFTWSQSLLDSGLIAPGLTSWNIWVKTDGQLWFSEWEYLDHLKGPVGFHPIAYEGYAPPVQLSQGLVHPKTFWYSIWSLCFQLATGKSPTLWSPEAPTPDTYRYLWHRDFYGWMSRFRTALVGEAEQAWVQFNEFQPPPHTFKNEAVWQSTRDANDLFWQGMSHYDAQNWPQAGECLQAALECNLLEPHHYRFLGKVFIAIKDTDSAMGCYDKALAIAPLGVLFFETGKHLLNILEAKSAITFFKQAVDAFPPYWQAWAALGEAYQHLEQIDRAAACYQRALEINPRNPQPYRGLHSIYSKLGMKEQADRYLKAYEAFDLGEPFFQIHFSEATAKSHNYIIKCADGHGNKITVNHCQECGIPMYLQPGEQIHNYVIDRIIVPGCYLQEMDSLGTQVALAHPVHQKDRKLILKESFMAGKMEIKAKSERYILTKVNHPKIPQLFDSFEENGRCYIAIEYIDGQEAKEYVAQQGGFGEAEVRQIFGQVIDVLSYLQQQNPPIIHGDIKPENIFLEPDPAHIRIIDYNGACEFNGNDTRAMGLTPVFSPPEQDIFSMVNLSSDLYALGVTCIYLLTGVTPNIFYDPTLRQFTGWDDFCCISAPFKDLILKLTVYEAPARPYPDVKTVLSTWQQVQKMPPLQQTPESKAVSGLLQKLIKVSAQEPLNTLMQQLNPLKKHYLILNLVAYRYFRMGLMKEAEATCKTLLALKPAFIPIYFTLADVYFEYQEWDKARDLLELALTYCDHYYALYHTLGKLYNHLGNYTLTIAAYKKTAQLNPKLYRAQLELAFVYYNHSAWRETSELCQWILEQKPQIFEAQQLLGMAYGKLGNYLDALRHLHEALALKPDDFDILFNLGITLCKTKNYAQAQTYFEKCNEQQPNQPEIIKWLNRCQTTVQST